MESARMRISLQLDWYQVNGINDGPCYLKMILMTFYVETNVMNFLLQKKVHPLPEKMQALKFDASVFSTYYVQDTVNNLSSGGQTSDDLLVYLFDSYKII